VLLNGCAKADKEFNASVQGAVTIDGQLAERGTVTFHPAKDGPVGSGHIFADGSYSIRTGQGNLTDPDGGGIRAGKYVVTVIVSGPPGDAKVDEKGGPPAIGPRMMADKYALKETSDLTFDIEAGPNVIDLKLEGPSAEPPAEAADDEKNDADKDATAEPSANGAPEGEIVASTPDGDEPEAAASADGKSATDAQDAATREENQ
jgi:hypothetical protein